MKGPGSQETHAKADQAVLGAIEQRLFTAEVVGLTIQEALALWQPAHDARDQQREALRAELRRLAGELARLTEAVVSGGDIASLVTALREREARCHDVRARLAAVEAPARASAGRAPGVHAPPGPAALHVRRPGQPGRAGGGCGAIIGDGDPGGIHPL